MIKYIVLLIFIFPAYALAFQIESVSVECGSTKKCKDFTRVFETFTYGEYSQAKLNRYLSRYVRDPSVKSFSYKLIDSSLVVNIKFKKIIRSVDIVSSKEIDVATIKSFIALKSGDFFSADDIEIAKNQINEYFSKRGYEPPDVHISSSDLKRTIRINISLVFKKIPKVRSISIDIENDHYKVFIANRFSKIIRREWNEIAFNKVRDSLLQELFNLGFYYTKVDSKIEKEGNSSVHIFLDVDLGEKTVFGFSGNHYFTNQELSSRVRQTIKNQLGVFNETELKNVISNLYKTIGHYNVNVDVRSMRGKTKSDIKVINYYIEIDEGRKVAVESVEFSGNYGITNSELSKLFKKNSSTLSGRGFVDERFLNSFSEILKNYYIKKGYIFAYCSDPKIRIEQNTAIIEYEIKEGQRSKLKDVLIDGIPEKYVSVVENSLSSKAGEYLNVLALPDDLTRSVKAIRNQGYYFATLTNSNEDSIISYSDDYSEATLNLKYNVEKKAILDSIIIAGNDKTKSVVITREFNILKGDVITPEAIESTWEKLSTLGLFSKIEISPFVTNKETDDDFYNVNLVVQVSEVDFGLIEFAPGYRTDLGLKFSSFISYNNVDGKNRSIFTKAQVNRKFSNSDIEKNRIPEDDFMLEYEVVAGYKEPYLFHIPMELTPEISVTRKRYFNFDADIAKFSFVSTKELTSNFTTSIKYQYETIDQYDATDEIDNGEFRIGSMTISGGLDLRNSEVSPREGTYNGLSFEYSSPFLFSMDDDDLRIEFMKIVSRNNFYIPLRDDLVFAGAASFGYQKNLSSKDDYIPSIKVFRLNGIDNVRGYSDDEVNRLKDGTDISDVVINDTAYFTNFKLEFRNYVSDNVIIGPFLDAGYVNENELNMSSMRYSTGITVKYLTPVGSIDFDYGVKLNRREDETFGAFHMAIGFF